MSSIGQDIYMLGFVKSHKNVALAFILIVVINNLNKT